MRHSLTRLTRHFVDRNRSVGNFLLITTLIFFLDYQRKSELRLGCNHCISREYTSRIVNLCEISAVLCVGDD